jgi:hypothetical protein
MAAAIRTGEKQLLTANRGDVGSPSRPSSWSRWPRGLSRWRSCPTQWAS